MKATDVLTTLVAFTQHSHTCPFFGHHGINPPQSPMGTPLLPPSAFADKPEHQAWVKEQWEKHKCTCGLQRAFDTVDALEPVLKELESIGESYVYLAGGYFVVKRDGIEVSKKSYHGPELLRLLNALGDAKRGK